MLLDRITPTAFACKKKAQHTIGLHTSLPVIIQEFALYCFAQKRFFPKIGNPLFETSPLSLDNIPPGLWLFQKTLQGMRDIPADTPRIVPVDPHRGAAAHYLTLLMLRFVWFHELAHGMLGHTDYLQAIHEQEGKAPKGMDELGLMSADMDSSSLSSEILQCMEFEADSSALRRCLLIQANGLENIEGIAAMPLSLRYRLTLFGMYAMTWLFETIQSTLQRSRLNVTHPAPFRRLEMLRHMTTWELKELAPDHGVIMGDALTQLELILSHIGEDWRQTDQFDPTIYRASFDQLRETLAPYRYLAEE